MDNYELKAGAQVTIGGLTFGGETDGLSVGASTPDLSGGFYLELGPKGEISASKLSIGAGKHLGFTLGKSNDGWPILGIQLGTPSPVPVVYEYNWDINGVNR